MGQECTVTWKFQVVDERISWDICGIIIESCSRQDTCYIFWLLVGEVNWLRRISEICRFVVEMVTWNSNYDKWHRRYNLISGTHSCHVDRSRGEATQQKGWFGGSMVMMGINHIRLEHMWFPRIKWRGDKDITIVWWGSSTFMVYWM